MAVEELLQNPQLQWQQTERELRKELPQVVAEHVLNLTEDTCQKAFESVWRRFADRLTELDSISKKKPSSRDEANRMRQRIFELTSPAEVARDLRSVHSIPLLADIYEREIQALSRILPVPQLVNRYRFSEDDLHRISSLAVSPAERAEVIRRLKQYNEDLKELGYALRVLKRRQEKHAGTRLAGSLAGAFLIPIPFLGSRIGRAIVDNVTGTADARLQVQVAADRVDQGWARLVDAIIRLSQVYEDRLRLVVLSLLSGLYLGIQRDLQQYGFTFQPGPEPGTFQVGVTTGRSDRLRQMYEKTEAAVLSHMASRDWAAADKTATDLLRLFTADVATRYLSYEGHNLFYRAYMLRYACIFSRAARLWEAGDKHAAASAWARVFSTCEHLLSDALLESLSGPYDTSWCAAARLATVAEELRLQGKTEDASRLLALPLEYYARHLERLAKEPALAGEFPSPELHGWCQMMYGFLQQFGYSRASLEALLDEKIARGDVVFPVRFFLSEASSQVRRGPLGRYLRQRMWKRILALAARWTAIAATVGAMVAVCWLIVASLLQR